MEDARSQFIQSLKGRATVLSDYSPYTELRTLREAGVVIDQLDSLLTNREQFIRLLGITGTALTDSMRGLIDWIEDTRPQMKETAELLEKAADEMERLEDQVESNDRLMGSASDRIESDGRYIEDLEADVKRLEYYEKVLCFSPPSKMVMTPDGACGMPEIENITKVIRERDALRKEIKAVKTERDQACDTLAAITELV